MDALSMAFLTCVVAWGAYKAGERRGERIKEASPSPSVSIVEDNQPENCAPDDTYVGRAKAAAEQIWKQHQESLDELRERSREHRTKIGTARDLLKEAELDKGLPIIWEEVRFYPSWNSQTSDDWSPPFGISGIVGNKEGDCETVEWTWRNCRFALTRTQRQSYIPEPDYNPVELSLTFNGQRVLAASYNEEYNDYGSKLRFTDVEAFVQGNWMAEVAELSALFETQSDASFQLAMEERDMEQAAGIILSAVGRP